MWAMWSEPGPILRTARRSLAVDVQDRRHLVAEQLAEPEAVIRGRPFPIGIQNGHARLGELPGDVEPFVALSRAAIPEQTRGVVPGQHQAVDRQGIVDGRGGHVAEVDGWGTAPLGRAYAEAELL